MTALAPDTNTQDRGEIISLLDKLKSADVINSKCVAKSANGSFYVEKAKGQLNIFQAADALLRRKPARKSA